MPATAPVIQRAFTGGEVSPASGARADTAQYLSGLALCKNCEVKREGGVANRAGFKYIAETKDSSKVSVLIPFIFEGGNQTHVLEVGDQYIRFFKLEAAVTTSGVSAWSGATAYVAGDLVTSGGTTYYCILAHTNQVPPDATYWYAQTGSIYEIPTPYLEADLETLKFTQSTDTLTITHPSYAPRDLLRNGATDWVLSIITTVPTIDAPQNVVAVAGVAGTDFNFDYVVTAAKTDTFEESVASTSSGVTPGGIPTIANPNTLTWDAVADAEEYYVYGDPFGNGIYGFIGTAKSNSFNDVGFAVDNNDTPPLPRTLYNATDAYPSVSSYYQQRRFFANINTNPELVQASQTGAYSNFGISTPLQDDDAIEFVLNSLTLNPVHHLIPLNRLVILTDEGEWLLRGDPQGGLTPTTLNAEQKGYVGSSNKVRPVVVGNSIFYVQSRGTVLRLLRFQDDIVGGDEITVGDDLTLEADHLFEGFSIKDIAYQQQPNSIVWAARSDGTLLGLTFVKSHGVLAWHQHTTGASGAFERIAVVPDTAGGEDKLYAVVKRTIDGSTVRNVEVLQSRLITTLATDAFFVDSGVTYSGTLISTITGLSHLEGEVLAVLADGEVLYDGDPTGDDAESYRVLNGQIFLNSPATDIHAGLPIRFAEIETLDMDVDGSSVRGRAKRLASLEVLVNNSQRQFWAGPDADTLRQVQPDAWDGAPEDVVTDRVGLSLRSGFRKSGRLRLRATLPLPWEVLAVIPNVELGG